MAGEISIATKERQQQIIDKLGEGIKSGGSILFNTPGTFSWTCPPGVKVVKLTMFGGGGSGSAQWGTYPVGYAGFGGAYVGGRPVRVNSGNQYSIVVGKGGAGVYTGSNGDKVNGETGGTSSALGISCYGGFGGGISSDERPGGNHYFVSKGAKPAQGFIPNIVTDPDSPLFMSDAVDVTSTPFGYAGLALSRDGGLCYGGGAGYGNGGDGGDKTTPVSPGAGSGGVVSLTGSVSSIKGGDGMVLIEW